MDYAQVSNRNLGAGTAVQAVPESGSRIRDAIGAAEQWISDLDGLMEQLEKRLDTVLTPSAPSANADKRTPPTPASHVMGRLVGVNEGHERLSTRIANLLQRIEI